MDGELVLTPGRLAFVGWTDAFGLELHALDLDVGHTLDLGGDLGGFALAASAPVLGGVVQVTGTLFPGMASVPGPVLLASSPVAGPTTAFLTPPHALWLDPLAFTLNAVLGSTFDVSFGIPLNPGLAGLELHVQAFAIDSGAPLAFVSSNGLRLVVGL
jgi:hypothetical protein